LGVDCTGFYYHEEREGGTKSTKNMRMKGAQIGQSTHRATIDGWLRLGGKTKAGHRGMNVFYIAFVVKKTMPFSRQCACMEWGTSQTY
jgi:hypothetical protein